MTSPSMMFSGAFVEKWIKSGGVELFMHNKPKAQIVRYIMRYVMRHMFRIVICTNWIFFPLNV